MFGDVFMYKMYKNKMVLVLYPQERHIYSVQYIFILRFLSVSSSC